MNAQQTKKQTLHISEKELLTFVGTMLGGDGGRPDDDHPLPPGPWDPIIRVALERMSFVAQQRTSYGRQSSFWGTSFEPQPNPWRILLQLHPEMWDAIGGGHSLLDEVALNPQPLPPRYAFLVSLAREVISRTEMLQEMAAALQQAGQERGIIIVSGYVSRFADDWCGTGYRIKFPPRGPRPHWMDSALQGIDYLILATQFREAAAGAYSPELRQTFEAAAAKFLGAGVSGMQYATNGAAHAVGTMR